MGRSVEALAVFADLVARRPGNPGHLACNGRLLMEHGRGAEATAVLDQAIAASRRRIELAPEDSSAHYYLGQSLVERGEWDGAMAELREAIRLHPDNSYARGYLGRALANRGSRRRRSPNSARRPASSPTTR